MGISKIKKVFEQGKIQPDFRNYSDEILKYELNLGNDEYLMVSLLERKNKFLFVCPYNIRLFGGQLHTIGLYNPKSFEKVINNKEVYLSLQKIHTENVNEQKRREKEHFNRLVGEL